MSCIPEIYKPTDWGADLKRIIAKMLGTDRIRVFSFYPDDEGQAALDESISRLSQIWQASRACPLVGNRAVWSATPPSGVGQSSKAWTVRTSDMCGIPVTIPRPASNAP